MSKRSYYEQLLSNPNVQKALKLISKAEGADYGTLVYYGTNNNQINQRGWGYSVHPSERGFKMPNGDGTTSSASGRYQIVGKTWRGLQRNGIVGKSFAPREQDIAGIALIDGRGALQDVLAGNVQGFIEKSRNEWESFKVRSMKTLLSYWDGGTNYTPEMSTGVNNSGAYIPAKYTLSDNEMSVLKQGVPKYWKSAIVWALALLVGFTVIWSFRN